MPFSVIIPSRNVANLVPCVKAIRDAGETARIIVVDDGVDFNQWPEPMGRVQLVDGVKPFVFSRNCNIGIRAAGDDDVILLNDDALLRDRRGFTALSELFDFNARFGIVGAVTNLTGQPLQQPRGVGLRQVPHIAFVCVYIPRSTINTVGMLDERYCIDYGCDDRDYCEAVNRAGLKVGVYDFCFVDHGSLKSSFRGDPRAPGDFRENYKLLMAKWGTLTE